MAPHAANLVVDPEALVLPDGSVSEEAAELLREFVHPPAQELEQRHKFPWFRRPSYWWVVCFFAFSMAVTGSTVAPKVEVYEQLVCRAHKPEIFDQSISRALGETPKACSQDPVVAATVSKLIAVVTTTLGILTCLTSAWWGSFSDRYGRTRVISLAATGLLITELNIITVSRYSHILPGGYWFILVGFILEGLLGGIVAGGAAIHSYIADTTRPETRSRSLSLLMGVGFIGFAIGPTLGGLLVRHTHNTLSVFYVASAIHLTAILVALLLIPESLTQMQMQQSRLKYNTSTPAPHGGRPVAVARRLFAFLTPLNIFLPELHSGKQTRDWNLTFLVAAYSFTMSLLGSYPYKFQYAQLTFEWDSATMGYFMSFVGAFRAIHLTVILPLVISFVKYILNKRRSSPEGEPLLSSESSAPTGPNKHSPRFDLNIARYSLLIEVFSFTCMAFSTTSLAFLGFGILGSLGGGFAPATQAVSLELFNRRGGTETGKLFGALSVVQALSSQIIGPAVYGLVFMNTVESFPRAIFFVSAGSVTISFLLMLCVRIPKRLRTEVIR